MDMTSWTYNTIPEVGSDLLHLLSPEVGGSGKQLLHVGPDNNMVLILYGNLEIVRAQRAISVIWSVSGIWAVTNWICSPKRPVFLNKCATCSELTTYLSTMNSNNVKCREGMY